LIALCAIQVGGARALTPPVVAIKSYAQLKGPLPLPYDAKVGADASVDSAAATAKTEHKLLLIELGANWCADCRLLAGVMALPEVRTFVDTHYVVVTVDIGRMNRNLQIPARYGVKGLDAVPALLVVDPNTGTLLNKGRVFALQDARRMTPQALADWLAQWTPA
jgi:thiol-disulfide isomerase/thioredoxin